MVGPSPAASAAAERVGPHPGLLVVGHRDDRVATDAEQRQRPVDGDMPAGTGEDPHGWRAGQTLTGDVPADGGEHVVAGGGQARHVRHLAPGDQPERDVRRQPEQVGHPPADHLLGDRGRGTTRVEAHVLVPGRRQPVGAERSGKAAADDEAEVARRPRGDQSAVHRRDELVDDGGRVDRRVVQLTAEALAQVGERGRRTDGAIVDVAQVAPGVAGGRVEGRVEAGAVVDAPSRLPHLGSASAQVAEQLGPGLVGERRRRARRPDG